MCYNSRAMLLAGTVERIRFRGASLEDNTLRDPVEREVIVYLPPSYAAGKRRYPVLFVLTGYASSNDSLLNFKPWEENLLRALRAADGAGLRARPSWCCPTASRAWAAASSSIRRAPVATRATWPTTS